MTDKEIRDAALAELKKTTQGYLKSNGQPRALVGAQWKKGLDLLAQIGQAAPPPGSPLLTRQVTLPTGATAFWLTHDSPNTQIVAGGGGRDKHRIIRWSTSPANSDPGLYSGRLTYAIFGFRMLSNGGNPGRMYDFHTQPNDDPHGWMPPSSPGAPRTGVAPVAIDYTGDSRGLCLQVQPEDWPGSGVYKYTILNTTQVEQLRGTWIWVWLEIRWGTSWTSGSDGGVRAWLHNETSPRVDMQGINTHWYEQHQITFWEGEYHGGGSVGTSTVEIAATRFGTTPQKAYEDVPVLFSTEMGGSVGGGAVGGSSVAIAPRLSTEASIPPSLRW